jgi:hypothetical protein
MKKQFRALPWFLIFICLGVNGFLSAIGVEGCVQWGLLGFSFGLLIQELVWIFVGYSPSRNPHD